jgi:hypothetical protein
MSAVWPSLLVFLLLVWATGVGFYVNRKLPERHRSRETVEVLHLAISLQVTFTAVALGLLVTSVKTGFEIAYQARATYAGQLAQLDRCLRDYGPQTAPTREHLRAYVAAIIASTWPAEPPPTGVSYPDVTHMSLTGEDSTLADLFDGVGLAVRGLTPDDPLHRSVAAACADDYAAAVRSRWAVIEGVRDSISAPFYWVMVFWLAILFGCLGLRAPPNRLNIIVFALCALSVSVAVFVIQGLDLPYGGLFGVSSESMRHALADMMR